MTKHINGVRLYDYSNFVNGNADHYDENFFFCYNELDNRYVDKRTGRMLRPFIELNSVDYARVYDSDYNSIGGDITMSLLCSIFGRNSYPYGGISVGNLCLDWDSLGYIKYDSRPDARESSDLIVYGINIQPAERHTMHRVARTNHLIVFSFNGGSIQSVAMPLQFAAKLLDKEPQAFRNELVENFMANTISININDFK